LNTIAKPVLDMPVTGVNLVPGRLRDQLEGGRTLLVFLRHFGCIFCRETVADLREIAERDDSFPQVLFFSEGSSTESRAFLRRYWPTARVVSDPAFEFYQAFGVGRASVIAALGPSVFRARSRAVKKGHENGPRTGDIWRMPGAFLVEGARVLWTHAPRHAADHPDFGRLNQTLAAET
jgi:peroxiredoxin